MLKIPQKPTKIIVLPDKFVDDFLTDFYRCLSLIFSNIVGGLQVVRSSKFNPRQRNLEMVVVVSLAHWPVEDMRKIKEMSKNVALICWYDDFIWVSEEARVLNVLLFDKSLCIIHASKYSHLNMWGKYEDKSFWLPLFAPPYFHKEFNCEPQARCLLSGSCSPEYYPLRSMVKNAKSHFVDVLNHPGYVVPDGNCVRKKYADILSSYSCCITGGGVTYGSCKYKITGEKRKFERHIDDYLLEMMGQDQFVQFKNRGQVVLKFFEIPSSGSLLIAGDQTTEMKELGYESGKNFMSVNKDNVLDVISDCCTNPDKYEDIRRNGWLLSKQSSIEHREDQLRNILGEAGVKV